MSELPGWVAAAIPAAVRLAAEAGTEVDDLLEHLARRAIPAARLADLVVRLEQSAELTEVATDLAVLLWAECEDVPRIATILDEPAAQAALEAVAEARRRAAGRLAEHAVPQVRPPTALTLSQPSPPRPKTAPAATGAVTAPPTAGRVGVARHEPLTPASPPLVTSRPRLAPPLRPAPVGGLAVRSAAGAVAAGAAAALVVFGRRLRRA